MTSKLKTLLLIFLALILIHHFWHHGSRTAGTAHTKVASANTKITDGNVYWDNLKPDTRTQAQWESQCNPAWAQQLSTDITSVWCTTPYNNSFDNSSALPASGWKWVSRAFHD